MPSYECGILFSIGAYNNMFQSYNRLYFKMSIYCSGAGFLRYIRNPVIFVLRK